MGRRFSDEEEKDIIEYYKLHSYKKTCEKFKIRTSHIWSIRKRYGVESCHNTKVDEQSIDLIKLKYEEQGHTLKQLAKDLKMSTGRIQKLLKDSGATIRHIGHHVYKASRTVNDNGYVIITLPFEYRHFAIRKGHAIAEHQFIMMKYLGRKLFKDENVHHLNGNRQDNRLENLELWSKKQPCGQRVIDKIEYAKQILEQYKDYVPNKQE